MGLRRPNLSLLKHMVNSRWYKALGGVIRGGMGATDAHDGRVLKGKTKATMQPMNDIGVRGLPFSGEEESQTLINNCSRGTHTTRGRKIKG